jgi:hypothetical protein
MRKTNLQKAVVLFVFLSFLVISASGLWAGPTSQTTVKPTFSLLLKSPIQFLLALFPGLLNRLNGDNPGKAQPPSSTSVTTVKPTGTIKSVRLGGGD